MEKGQPANFCSQMAECMRTYTDHYRYILKDAWEYDPEAIKLIGDSLTPLNFCAIVATSASISSPNIERWYGTEYWVEDCDQEFLQGLLSHHMDSSVLHLPRANVFIPEHLHVKPVERLQRHPELLVNNEQYKLWHKHDAFGVPKGCFDILLRTPIVYQTAENHIKTGLVTELINDALSEYLYEASLAGLSFLMGNGVEGLLMGMMKSCPISSLLFWGTSAI